MPSNEPPAPRVAPVLLAFLMVLVLPALGEKVEGEGGLQWFGPDATALHAQSLRGSPASLDRQNHQARSHDFTYLQTPAQVRRFVELGYLVPVRPTENMGIHNVSFPYARPEVRTFLHRLSAQYRAACGERLVVTSLTRPISNQPPNASSRSVHPTGMALDLRVSQNAQCRSWLESTLMSLEGQGLIEAIRERRPPHYHVAVFPQPYTRYVAQITGEDRVASRADEPEIQLEWVTHQVRRGEHLTGIAQRYGTTVTRLRSENRIQGNRILVGQALRVPVYQEVSSPSRTAQAQTTSSEASESQGPAESETGEASGPESSERAAIAENGERDEAESATHRVARGETLSTIAQRYGVSQAELRRANGISGSRILAGQELTIPGAGTPAQATTHRVARGESLWGIARRYGVSQDAVRRANGISGNRILIGQELTIPAGGGTAQPTTHRVARGESLWVIAQRHGTSVDQIRRENGIGSSGRIVPGQVLTIPGSGR
jgi:LysM repeat protein